MLNFPSQAGDRISVIPSDFLSNSAIPDEKSADSAPPPGVKPPGVGIWVLIPHGIVGFSAVSDGIFLPER